MKERIITLVIYLSLILVGMIIIGYNLLLIMFNDIVNYYCGGILKFIFVIVWALALILPVLKYKRYKQKWILPMVLMASILIAPIFNNGILKFVEDDLRIYSKEKWDKYKELRIYMIDDLDSHYIMKGMKEEFVIDLLGEPTYIKEESPRFIEYYVSPGYVDPVRYYIMFEDGKVVETGKHHT